MLATLSKHFDQGDLTNNPTPTRIRTLITALLSLPVPLPPSATTSKNTTTIAVPPRHLHRPHHPRRRRTTRKGGEDAGLNEAYIQKIRERAFYTPTETTLALRAAAFERVGGFEKFDGEGLQAMTVDELAQLEVEDQQRADLAKAVKEATEKAGEGAAGATADLAEAPLYAHLAVFGLVMRLPREKVFFSKHRGRDNTARWSRQRRGISMDMHVRAATGAESASSAGHERTG